jgi:predicted RNase H-like HicB family nuclease
MNPHPAESEVLSTVQYDILLTKRPGNGYIARPVLWPEVVAAGADEAEALAAIHEALAEFLANSRIVQIEVPGPQEATADPWLRFAGMWSGVADAQW